MLWEKARLGFLALLVVNVIFLLTGLLPSRPLGYALSVVGLALLATWLIAWWRTSHD